MVNNPKVIFVDVDETICESPSNRDYSKAKPIYDNITKINKLYDVGHQIIYWTARGTLNKDKTKNWFNTTHTQLERWGCRFHELRMGKPVYDLFIDDKNMNVRDIDETVLLWRD